jgi:hypothetical protein
VSSVPKLVPVLPHKIVLALIVAFPAEMVATVVAHAIKAHIRLLHILHIEAPSLALAAEKVVWVLGRIVPGEAVAIVDVEVFFAAAHVFDSLLGLCDLLLV